MLMRDFLGSSSPSTNTCSHSSLALSWSTGAALGACGSAGEGPIFCAVVHNELAIVVLGREALELIPAISASGGEGTGTCR